MPYPLASRETDFYYNGILGSVNTIHYSEEEVVNMQRALMGYRVPEEDGLIRYNMVFRMMQVCLIAKHALNDLAEKNRVTRTTVDDAQLAGAGDAVCEELTRLWKSQK